MPPNSSWIMIANGQQPTDSRNTTHFEKRVGFGRHGGQTIRRYNLIKGTTPAATRRDGRPRPTPVEALKAFTYSRCSVNGPCPQRIKKMVDTTSHQTFPQTATPPGASRSTPGELNHSRSPYDNPTRPAGQVHIRWAINQNSGDNRDVPPEHAQSSPVAGGIV